MNLILDTSILIAIEKGDAGIIEELKKLKSLYPAPPKISFVSYFEFFHWLRKKNVKNKQESLAFLDLFEVIHTTKETARVLSMLKEKYELPLADLLIAAQTIESDGVLFSKDKDFVKISGLNKVIL
jgi:predicted nucleic acid-binding protein